MLRTHSETASNFFHVRPDVVTVDERVTGSGWKHPRQHRPTSQKNNRIFSTTCSLSSHTEIFLHGCGLASPVVTQKRRDLTFVKVQGQLVDRHLLVLVDLRQIIDADAERKLSWLRLETRSICRART